MPSKLSKNVHPTEARLSDAWAGAPGYKHILQLTPQAVFEDVKDQVQLVLQKYPQSAGSRQLRNSVLPATDSSD